MFDRNKFDRDFERTRKAAMIFFIINAVISLAVLAGLVFVVFKVLTHFGIL